LAENTLAERISKFSKVRIRKLSVKVPRLSVRRLKAVSKVKADKIPVSSIINILIKNAVEKTKRERKEKPISESKSYYVLKDDGDLITNGGYGTVSKGYGSKPHASYVDYDKLFSYLGSFRSKQPYENMADHLRKLNTASESGSFVLADRDSMDKAGRFDKYIRSPVMAMQTMALSLVPIAGLSSAEWEEIKMLMRFDPVTYTLKSKTS